MKRLLPLLGLLFLMLAPAARGQGGNRMMEILVVTAESGEPVAGAKLTGRLGEEREARVTDAAGRVEVLLPAEAVRIDLRLQAPGRVPVRAVWTAAEAAPGVLPATTEARMPVGVGAAGRVTAPGGEPVAGAEVRVTEAPDAADARAWRPALKGMTFETDADGRWSSDAFPADPAAVRLSVSHPSYRTASGLVPGAGELTTKLGRGIRVTGTVVDASGAAVPFASVHLGFGPFSDNWPGVAADAAGRFAVEQTEPGTPRLLVEADGFAPVKQELEVGEEGIDVGKVVLKPGVSIGGRVVDAGGDPRAGVRVWLSSWDGMQLLAWETATDADGRWGWTEAPRSERLSFSLSGDGLTSVSLTVEAPGEAGPDVVMRPQIVVTGRVTDAATGEPIDAFTVQPAFYFRADDDRRTRIGHEQKEFTGGAYRMALRHPYHRLCVDIEAPGYRTAASPGYPTDGEQRNFTFDAALEKDEGFTGRVVDATGAPVAGAEVWIEEAGQQIRVTNGRVEPQRDQPGPMISDADGRFGGPKPAPGFVLLVLADAGWCWAGPDAAEPGTDLTLEPWAQLRGEIFRGPEPVEGAKPWISRGMSEHAAFGHRLLFEQEQATDASGRFTLDRVRPGVVNVAARVPVASGGYTGAQWTRVELEPGETSEVRLGGRGRPVTGRLLIPDAVPPDDSAFGKRLASIRRGPVDGMPNRFSAPFDEDGVFFVEDVPPGTYRFFYQRLGHPQGRADAGRVVEYAEVETTFTVPPMDEPVSDEPLDLGDLPVAVFPENLPPAVPKPEAAAVPAETSAAATEPAGVTPPVGPLPGLTAPPVVLDLLGDAGRFDLADHAGGFVVLDFWATWCGPCVKALPALEALHAEQDPGRVAFLSLSLDDDKDALTGFLGDRPSPWPQAHAGGWGESALAEAYAVRAVPMLVLIGPDGRILHRGHGVRALAVALEEAVTGARP